jgi:4-hydroxy-tetrahydrodipicolinate synthase
MRGVHTALVTPFTADGTVDFPAFRSLVRRQLDQGIHGLVPCGTTGETPTLTREEWASLVSISLEEAGGRVPVTAGVGTNDTRSTVANCVQAKSLGADAGLLVFPYYNKPNAHGLRQHVAAATETGLPIVLYHVPGRTGQRLGHELLGELASMPGVIAVKEATGDLRFGSDVITLTRTPILSGDDFTFLPLLSMGGTGVISVVSNVDPAGTVAVYDAWAAGDHATAAARMYRLWALTTFLFVDANPIPCKAALAELGLCRADLRLPLTAFTGKSCRPLLHDLGLL